MKRTVEKRYILLDMEGELHGIKIESSATDRVIRALEEGGTTNIRLTDRAVWERLKREHELAEL